MYELTVSCHFDAAHSLRGYPGECYRLHGHTWTVEATVSAEELDELGIVYDFKLLKADLNSVLERYDHLPLNDVEPFTEISPTAENLARVIYERLAETIAPAVHLVEVAVWESPVAKLTYRP
jgi:6-pyruvoyltetrahydropterin/6-carboxytetrahydropterin synthase